MQRKLLYNKCYRYFICRHTTWCNHLRSMYNRRLLLWSLNVSQACEEHLISLLTLCWILPLCSTFIQISKPTPTEWCPGPIISWKINAHRINQSITSEDNTVWVVVYQPLCVHVYQCVGCIWVGSILFIVCRHNGLEARLHWTNSPKYTTCEQAGEPMGNTWCNPNCTTTVLNT